MCGIAGIIHFEHTHADGHAIRRMTDALTHRGPDGGGVLTRGPVALGHRRLSIIDPAAGAQPMCNEDQTVWVTFNGEIYNFAELRQQLESCGHQFKTRCDTEVIVHGFEQWGADCVRRLRGMFAFAVVDLKTGKGVLARDHFGIKPVVYEAGPNRLAFASELASLRHGVSSDHALDVDLTAIEFFLRFQYIPAPRTIYQGVRKLLPGHYLEFDLHTGIGEPVRYWRMAFAPDRRPRPDQDWVEEFDAVLTESVKAHLVSDVPFGVFLSGGVDSTLVAWKMSELLDRPVRGFTIGFDENDHSEIPYARQAAKRIGFELIEQTVQNDFWDKLPGLISHYGEPFGDSSAVPTWAVSALARSHVPMVLSGDGGDELFGGYHSYTAWLKPSLDLSWKRWQHSHSAINARGLARTLARQVGGNWNLQIEWQRIVQYTTFSVRRSLWRQEHREQINRDCQLFDDAHDHAEAYDALAYAQSVDIATYLPGAILPKVDIASMYHGLEVRPPLLDVKVAEFAARVPAHLRMARHPVHGMVGKPLLKTLLTRKFPEEFVHRTKMGFAMPRDRWLLAGQPGRKLLEDLALPGDSPLHKWFQPAIIRNALDSHVPGREDGGGTLWLLLVLGLWARENLCSSPASTSALVEV